MSLIGQNQFEKGRGKPDIVGHRGFRGRFPENTLLALREGARAGATVLETDIQLASDDVVVMCHDVDTGRVFNQQYLVEETPYFGVLDQLYTKDKFKERMPTLIDVCHALLEDPDFANANVMIDIKRSNDPHVVPHMVKALESVAPIATWKSRVQLGVWRLDVLQAVEQHVPGLDVVFIGWQHQLSRAFLQHEQVKAISLNYSALAVSGGQELMDLARANDKDIYAWTVNSPEPMKWAVAARLRGVITDYPDVLDRFLNTVSEKDLMSEYFTSEPNQFYSLGGMVKLYLMYLAATFYLLVADNLPGFVRKY